MRAKVNRCMAGGAGVLEAGHRQKTENRGVSLLCSRTKPARVHMETVEVRRPGESNNVRARESTRALEKGCESTERKIEMAKRLVSHARLSLD
jgi:hypothetical protein